MGISVSTIQKARADMGTVQTTNMPITKETVSRAREFSAMGNQNTNTVDLKKAQTWQSQEVLDQEIAKLNKLYEDGHIAKWDLDPAVSYLENRKKAYANFGSVVEYNRAVKDASLSEKYSGYTYDQKQEAAKNSTDQYEIEWLSNYGMRMGYSDVESYEKELAAIDEKINKTRTEGMMYVDGCNVLSYDAQQKINELEAKKGYFERTLQHIQTTNKVNSEFGYVVKQADFQQKSIPDKEVAKENFIYDQINNLDATNWFSYALHMTRDVESVQQLGLMQTMEEDELKIYNYLANTEGIKRANEYVSVLAPILNQRQNTEIETSSKKFAKEYPILSNVVSVPIQLVDGVVGAPLKFVGNLTGDYQENWSSYDTLTNVVGSIRGQTAEDITKNYGSGWATVYSAGMSIVDMGAAFAVGKFAGLSAKSPEQYKKVVSGITEMLMSSQAASGAMTSARERGLDTLQIAATGVAAYAIESLTEKYGLDAILDDSSKFILKISKSAASNGLEEATSNILNTLFDEAVAGHKSEIKTQIAELMANGKSYQQAANEVLTQKLEEIGMDALVGSLIGGILGGFESVSTRSYVQYSAPKTILGDLPSVKNWVVKTVNKNFSDGGFETKKIGKVDVDTHSLTESIQSSKTADEAVAFTALKDTLRKGKVLNKGNNPVIVVGAPAILNGNQHVLSVTLAKTKSGGYLVAGLTLDADTVLYNVADPQTMAQDMQTDLSGKETSQAFDYESLSKISQGSKVTNANGMTNIPEGKQQNATSSDAQSHTQESVNYEALEKYDQRTYTNRGWVVVNKVLTGKELKKFNSQWADATKNRYKYPHTVRGETIITVGDGYGDANTLVYVNGTFENPIITKVVRIVPKDLSEVSYLREQIIMGEDNGDEYIWAIVKSLAGEESFIFYTPQDFGTYSELTNTRAERQGLPNSNGNPNGGSSGGGNGAPHLGENQGTVNNSIAKNSLPSTNDGTGSFADVKNNFEQQNSATMDGDITQTINNEFERENISNGERAIAFLINEARAAENPEKLIVENAMFRPDIGNIDFVWGVPGKGDKFKHGYGISHIIAKRNSENGSGMETVKKIVEVIARAKSVNIQRANNGLNNERIKLTYDDCTAVLSQNPEGNHWLLTGWQNEKETATYANGEVRDSSEATAVTPTLTRRNGGNVTVSDNSISNPDEIVNEDIEDSNPDVLESRAYDYMESKENWTAENRNEGSSAEVESLDDIVSNIEETFGIPINKGNIRQENAAGIFKSKVNAIRTQLGNALPVICHEVGHHLDLKHQLVQLESIDEAVEVMQKTNPAFAKLYGANQQKREAIAEFIREYLRDRKVAKQKYPKFFTEVTNALGEDLGKLNAISDQVNAYMYASLSEQIAANTTNRTNVRRNKNNFAKRLKSTIDKVVKHMFEDAIAIRDVSEKAYNGVYDARKAPTVINTIIREGMVDVDGNYVDGFENVNLYKILEPINNTQSKGRFKKLCESLTGHHESSYDEFNTYLILKRGLDLANRGIPIFRNGDPSMQDPAAIQQQIDKMEAEYPEFKGVAEQLYTWEKALGQTYYVNTGAMSQAEFDSMWERDPHYVPFNRNIKREIVKNGSSSKLGKLNPEIKRIKGGSEALFDAIENIVLRSAIMVQNAKNRRIMQILALDVENGSIDSSIMEKISETKAGAINAALDQQTTALKAGDETDGTFDDIDLVEWTGQAVGENIVWATINGERVLYEVHDTALLQALLNSTPHQADVLIQVIGKVNSAFKMATTGASLIWSITSNSFRDFATGYYYGSEGNILKYTRDYFVALRDVIENRQSYKDAEAAGLGYTSRVASPKTLSRVMLGLGQNQKGRRVLTNAFNSIIEGIQSVSEVVEATPRLAEYKRAINQGKSKTDAVYAASEVTLNFDRKGDWSKKIDLVYPFFNVQMQGLYKQARMIADPNTRMQFIRRRVVSAFVMAAFVVAANAVLGGKEEYEKLSDYVKNNYYCFYIGNGKFIKIPKARELDVLESALERMAETICYDNEFSDSFNGFAEYIFQAYAPLGFPDITALFTENGTDKLSEFVKPTVTDLLLIGSFAELGYNENYAGSPIVPTQYQDLVATEQYDNKTSGVAKLLGHIFNVSPMQIDHLMTSNTGFIGKLLKAWTAEDFDWTGGYGNQFTADVAYSNDVSEEFYDGLDEAKMYATTYPENAEYQARYQHYSSVSSVVSYFYRQAKADPENARAYRMLAVAYAEECLNGSDIQSEKLNALYQQTGKSEIYPFREFQPSYSQEKKDEKGNYVRDEYDNIVSEEITMTSQQFLEYINTYNETIDVVYEEILSGITEPKLVSKALVSAKKDINDYSRTGVFSNVMVAREAGISSADYYQITLGSSTNGASGVNQDEAKIALNNSNLSQKQCAVMWDLMFPNAKSNPYKKRYY